jgi:hypothetical protein
MRILVTGSRDWPHWNTVNRALLEYAWEQDIVIVHGDCPTGADAMAQRFCDYQLGGRSERYPADWSLGRRAGPERNRKMVDLGADVCLAFISSCTSPRCKIDGDHPSHGASGTADMAEAAGIPVRRFYA